MADLWATGISPTSHPIEHIRVELQARGVLSAAAMTTTEPGRRVRVGGVVTHRQRPATAGGVTFPNLEDETRMINVVCSQGMWNRHRRGSSGVRRAGGTGLGGAVRGRDQPGRRPT